MQQRDATKCLNTKIIVLDISKVGAVLAAGV